MWGLGGLMGWMGGMGGMVEIGRGSGVRLGGLWLVAHKGERFEHQAFRDSAI